MTQQIIIEETFARWPTRIVIQPEGVWVSFNKAGHSDQFLYWDEIDNPELLTEKFGYIPVCVFVAMVKKLAEIHAQQDTYKELL